MIRMAISLPLGVLVPGVFLLGAATPAAAASATPGLPRLELGLSIGADILSSQHALIDTGVSQNREFARVAPDFGVRLGFLPVPFFGVELESGLAPTDVGARNAILYGFSGNLIGQYPLLVRNLTPFAVPGGGVLGVRSQRNAVGNDVDGSFHWGIGLKYPVLRWATVRLDLRHVISDGTDGAASHYAALASFSFLFEQEPRVLDQDGDRVADGEDQCRDKAGLAPSGCPDFDNDGTIDREDACPTVAAPSPDGCPIDRDRDGVPDEQDRCPAVAGKTADGCPGDQDGDEMTDDRDKCPTAAAKTADGCPPDADRDGVPDEIDKCPIAAGTALDGCPPDQDGDGRPDKFDKCPTVAAKTADGCPGDQDGDGALDEQDQCPNQPELSNGFQDDDGCPDELSQEVRSAIGIVVFNVGSAQVRPAFNAALDKVVTVVQAFPGLRIKIRGFTDKLGNVARNEALSLQRAEAVKAYVVAKKVAADRIEVEGVGSRESAGIGDKDRRIEIVIVE
ncbi:MAG: thrombospondin type 3 repeat-containing protein [Pseudomonadota bacterium]